MRQRRTFSLFLICFVCFGFLSSRTVASPAKHAVTARAATEPPRVDGRLDDPGWQHADWFDDFVQKFPVNGAPPSRNTSVAVLYDDDFLYLGIKCDVSSRDEIVTRMVRRDREAEYDYVEVVLSPRNDNRTGYSFLVNPSGVKRDRYFSADSTSDAGWDGVWQAETHISDTAWTLEMALPLDQLRFKSGQSVFGFQVFRWISALQERNLFSPVPDNRNGTISNAGELRGVSEIRAKPPLILIPESYLSVGATTAGYDTRRRDGFSFGGGGYAKAGLGADLVLDMAVLPDFGQVEVDEVVLNLSTHETLFPEKRPFFLEGAGLFTTPIQLFYSRRLGQPPPSPALSDDESIASGGALTPILGAVKLTGRTEKGLSFGVSEAILMPTEFETENDETGRRTLRNGTPWTNAFALRTISEVGKNSTVGMLGTALNPSDSDGAYAGGVDWVARSPARIYAFRGQVAGSVRFDDVQGNEPTHGAGFWTKIGREGGEPIRYTATYSYYSKGFDPNELGYLKRGDLHSYIFSGEYSYLKQTRLTDQIYTGGGADGSWNLNGTRLYHSVWLWQSYNFRNRWFADITLYGGPAYFDDHETRGGPPLWRPFFLGAKSTCKSPEDKPLGALLGVEGATKAHGFALTVWGAFYLRLGRFELELAPKLKETRGDPAYVATRNEDELDELTIGGRRNLTEFNLSLKGTVVFTRELTFQLYSQLLNIDADYSHYGEVMDNGRLSSLDYRDDDGNPKEKDFARTDLVVQALLRWEYRPGSTLFLIYTHRGFVDVSQRSIHFRDTLGDIANEEREQLFMLKLSHRFG